MALRCLAGECSLEVLEMEVEEQRNLYLKSSTTGRVGREKFEWKHSCFCRALFIVS